MVLSENLKKANIILKVKSQNKWDLINELIDNAVKNKEILEEDKDEFKKALIEREKSMSTGIGNGVAIPHCTTSKIKEIVCIMSINQKGIDFDAIDNQPVKIIIMILVPKSKLTQHIKTLANIAKVMSNEKLREKLLLLKTPESILKEIKDLEQ